MVNESTQPVITGRGGPTANLIRWEPLEGQLPMRHSVHGSRAVGVVALVIGLPWLYLTAEYWLGLIARHGMAWGQTLPGLLVAGGLAVSLFGLSQFIYRDEIRIGDSRVSRRRLGLTGRSAWREPLSRYRGVLRTQRLVRNESHDRLHGSSDYMRYGVTLYHDDPSRRVLLYEVHDTLMRPPAEWERMWRHYANLFRLPLLEADAGGGDGTVAAEPDSSLAERLVQNSEAAPNMDPEHPRLPAGLSLHRDADLRVVTLWPVVRIRNVAVLLLAGPLLLVLGMFLRQLGLSPGALASWAAAGLLFLVGLASLVALRKSLQHPEQVAVDAHSIWHRTWDRHQRTYDTQQIPLHAVQRIVLDNTPALHYRGERVVVDGPGRRLEMGHAIGKRRRRTLRDLLCVLLLSEVNTSDSGGKR